MPGSTKRTNPQQKHTLPKRGRVSGTHAKQTPTETFSCVRVKLSRYLTPAGKECLWQAYVLDGNKSLLEALVLANRYVVSRLAAKAVLPELNQTFFYQCLRQITSQGSKSDKIPGLTDLGTKHRSERHTSYEPVSGIHFTAFAQNASRQMLQNLQVRASFL